MSLPHDCCALYAAERIVMALHGAPDHRMEGPELRKSLVVDRVGLAAYQRGVCEALCRIWIEPAPGAGGYWQLTARGLSMAVELRDSDPAVLSAGD